MPPFCGIGLLKGLCHVQDRLEEAETRENQSREEGEKAKADLFQVGHHLSTFYSILNTTCILEVPYL